MEKPRKVGSPTVKKCLPCIVHGEHIPLKQLVVPLIKKRDAITEDAIDDDIVDDAWDDFEEALDGLNIQYGEYPDDIDFKNGFYEVYIDGEHFYFRKRKA